jgi:aryl-alcohol dehydrogenase-like predicted oxidoreductase
MDEHRNLGKVFARQESHWAVVDVRNVATKQRRVHRSAYTGINFFDTANVCERVPPDVLEKVLKDYRPSLVVAKVISDGDGPNDRGLSRKHIIESCDASLKRLDMDYLTYQCPLRSECTDEETLGH